MVKLFKIVIVIIFIVIIYILFFHHNGTTTSRIAQNKYYSYAKTILEGGVIPSMSCLTCGSGGTPINGQIFATVGDVDMDNGSPLYEINYGPWKGQTYIDFDASSGLMCGNSWGQPSKQAEIIYNMLSLNAPNPVIKNLEIHKMFVNELYYVNGAAPTYNDWQSQVIIQPPQCYKSSNYFMNGGIYLGGFMGLKYNSLPDYINWGHFGETYGYTSLTQFFPGSITNFTGILEKADVTFVIAQNTDTLGQGATADALNSLIVQLSGGNWGIIDSEDKLKTAMCNGISYAYCADKNIQCANPTTNFPNYPGLTMTIGYFFISNKGKTYQGSTTMSIIDNKIQIPTNEYSFENKGKIEYLGARDGREPAYYYGSGTKPITTFLTVNAIANAWLLQNPKDSAEQFMKWFRGRGIIGNIYSNFGAATMKDILNLTDNSYYTEELEKYDQGRDISTIGIPKFTLVKHTIQEWYDIIFNNYACQWRGLSQDNTRCPTNQCYELELKSGIPDPSPFKNCSCTTLTELNSIFYDNLTPIEMMSMRGGIPDADTISTSTAGLVPSTGALQLDYIDQIIGRTQSIGPINYARELIGFNWIPGWKDKTTPNTFGLDGKGPPAEYSSSGFSLLGTILWILDPLGPKKINKAIDWSLININKSFLPPSLENNNNFAGTSGNGGNKYFVSKGSQPQLGVLKECNVSNSKRVDCIGPRGSDKNICLDNKNCCYQPSIIKIDNKSIPWCFKKT